MATKMVVYNEGPLRMSFGEAGTFYLGVPREIPEYLANILIRKGLLKEVVNEPTITVKRKKEG